MNEQMDGWIYSNKCINKWSEGWLRGKLYQESHTIQGIPGFFFVAPDFELRTLYLLGRCSATGSSYPALFCLSYFSGRVLCFCPGASFRP
jgi:hypothetical protein